LRVIAIIALLVSITACEDFGVDRQLTHRSLEVPAHFPEPFYDFRENPLTEEGFELGRRLFYDERLSRGAQVSCGTCHSQPRAFSDPRGPVSFGVDGKKGQRNAPGLFNLAWEPEFMWDGGITHIELTSISPLTDSAEMDFPVRELLAFLDEETEYPEAFDRVFGSPEITLERFLKALSQFQGSMISADSPYDRYMSGDRHLTNDEVEGMKLFEEKCGSCHAGHLQSDFSYRNNGLDKAIGDYGRGRITLREKDFGKFRVPSLRNAVFTAPYMHDGRFKTLRDVLDHYSEGIQNSPTLDTLLANGIPLSKKEKDLLLKFLHTLSDSTLISDERFADPRQN